MRMQLRSAIVFFVGLLAFSVSALGTGAQDATPISAAEVLAPDVTIDGHGLADWSARSWQWYFSVPSEINPFNDETGARCGYGQNGPVFFLAGAPADIERQCTVPNGVTLFNPIAGAECSTVEEPPFFGSNEASLRQCAQDAVDYAESVLPMELMKLVVDGKALTDFSGYRVLTSQFPLILPDGNELRAPAGIANSVADGYCALVGPLSPGEHEITFAMPEPDGAITVTYHLTVQSGEIAPT